MPSMTEMPNSAMKPIAAETLKGMLIRNSAKIPPTTAIGMTLIANSVSGTEPKLIHSSSAISARLSGTTILRPRDRVLQIAELADPFEPRARRQRHLLGDLALRLLDRAAEIAVAHAELDRQIAFLPFAVDIGGAGDQLDGGDLAQRNLGDAARPLHADAQVLDRRPDPAGIPARAAPRWGNAGRCRAHKGRRPIAADAHADGGVDVPGVRP